MLVEMLFSNTFLQIFENWLKKISFSAHKDKIPFPLSYFLMINVNANFILLGTKYKEILSQSAFSCLLNYFLVI